MREVRKFRKVTVVALLIAMLAGLVGINDQHTAEAAVLANGIIAEANGEVSGTYNGHSYTVQLADARANITIDGKAINFIPTPSFESFVAADDGFGHFFMASGPYVAMDMETGAYMILYYKSRKYVSTEAAYRLVYCTEDYSKMNSDCGTIVKGSSVTMSSKTAIIDKKYYFQTSSTIKSRLITREEFYRVVENGTSEEQTVPTVQPTQEPTTVPTQAPTATPTTVPTQAPTATPTTVPTQAPTATPTTVPTQAPTATCPCGNGGTCTCPDGQCKCENCNCGPTASCQPTQAPYVSCNPSNDGDASISDASGNANSGKNGGNGQTTIGDINGDGTTINITNIITVEDNDTKNDTDNIVNGNDNDISNDQIGGHIDGANKADVTGDSNGLEGNSQSASAASSTGGATPTLPTLTTVTTLTVTKSSESLKVEPKTLVMRPKESRSIAYYAKNSSGKEVKAKIVNCSKKLTVKVTSKNKIKINVKKSAKDAKTYKFTVKNGDKRVKVSVFIYKPRVVVSGRRNKLFTKENELHGWLLLDKNGRLNWNGQTNWCKKKFVAAGFFEESWNIGGLDRKGNLYKVSRKTGKVKLIARNIKVIRKTDFGFWKSGVKSNNKRIVSVVGK